MNLRRIILSLVIMSIALSVFPQKDTLSFDIKKASMKFPHRFKKWKFKTSAGFSMVKLPYDLVENAYQAPLVNIHTIFGFPSGFALEGDLSTLVISNQIAIGPRWNFIHKNFSFNVGYDLAFILGKAAIGGFDNLTTGWIHYPNLSVGYKVKDIAFTLKGELVIIASLSNKAGENEVTHTKNYFDGGTVGLYIEQRITKKNVFILGIKDNYVKFYWPVWMMFSTFDRYFNIPELYFGWIL